jgi:hypothetical protein
MPKIYLTLNLPLSKEHYTAIGRVAANWAMIEGTLERFIWFITSLGEDAGRCVTTYMAYRNRMQALLSLTYEANLGLNGGPFKQKEHRELAKYLEELRNCLLNERNAVVHGVWTIDEAGMAGIVKTYATKELEVEIQEWSANQIENLADRIEAAFIQLNELLIAVASSPRDARPGPPSWLERGNWSFSE